MPKLPPPPRSPQSRSAFSDSLAWTSRPSAVTTSAPTRLSQARPYLRISQPMPPPRVKPPTPVVETRPPVVARPYAWVSWSTSAQTAPPPTVARRASGSTRTPFIGERSITIPSSTVENPATLWPPPRTAIVQVVAAREADRRDHVGGAGAADDQRRPAAVVRAVPDPARFGVAVVARSDDLSREPLRAAPAPSLPRAPVRWSGSSPSPFVVGSRGVVSGGSLRRLSGSLARSRSRSSTSATPGASSRVA